MDKEFMLQRIAERLKVLEQWYRNAVNQKDRNGNPCTPGLAKELTTLPLRILSPSKRIVLTGMLQTVSKAKTEDIISITASVERAQKVFMMVQSPSLSLLLQMASTNSTDMSETKTDLYSTTILFSILPF